MNLPDDFDTKDEQYPSWDSIAKDAPVSSGRSRLPSWDDTAPPAAVSEDGWFEGVRIEDVAFEGLPPDDREDRMLRNLRGGKSSFKWWFSLVMLASSAVVMVMSLFPPSDLADADAEPGSVVSASFVEARDLALSSARVVAEAANTAGLLSTLNADLEAALGAVPADGVSTGVALAGEPTDEDLWGEVTATVDGVSVSACVSIEAGIAVPSELVGGVVSCAVSASRGGNLTPADWERVEVMLGAPGLTMGDRMVFASAVGFVDRFFLSDDLVAEAVVGALDTFEIAVGEYSSGSLSAETDLTTAMCDLGERALADNPDVAAASRALSNWAARNVAEAAGPRAGGMLAYSAMGSASRVFMCPDLPLDFGLMQISR